MHLISIENRKREAMEQEAMHKINYLTVLPTLSSGSLRTSFTSYHPMLSSWP